MRRILIESTMALALSIAPGLVFAQTETPETTLPGQSQGQGGGQNMEQQQPGGQGGGQKMDQEKPGAQKMEQEKPGGQGGGQKMEQEKPGGQKMEQGKPGGGQKSGAHLDEKQRGALKQAFRGAHVEPAPNVDFSVDVGRRVPREIRLHRLPPRIVEVVPAYEGYEYFVLADGRIVIVDPQTHEIVLAIQ